MRILVAGASGVIGRRLVPMLVSAGHEVTGITRSRVHADRIRGQGAAAVICDTLHRNDLMVAVADAGPEVVVNQLTSIPSRINPRRVGEAMAATNRLRDEGTRHLADAAREAGARRLVSQSVAFGYRPTDRPAVETDPLYLDLPPAFRPLVNAVAACEDTTTSTPGLDGVVLRYGFFYGPHTIYARDGTFAEDVRRRRVPIVGRGDGVFSFIHVDDAAAATVAAITGPPGTYNVVDDEPAPVRDWLPFYAETVGAPRPRRVPVWLGRLGAGAYGIYVMVEQRGASNDAAKAALDWTLRYPTWRKGFLSG